MTKKRQFRRNYLQRNRNICIFKKLFAENNLQKETFYFAENTNHTNGVSKYIYCLQIYIHVYSHKQNFQWDISSFLETAEWNDNKSCSKDMINDQAYKLQQNIFLYAFSGPMELSQRKNQFISLMKIICKINEKTEIFFSL